MVPISKAKGENMKIQLGNTVSTLTFYIKNICSHNKLR